MAKANNLPNNWDFLPYAIGGLVIGGASGYLASDKESLKSIVYNFSMLSAGGMFGGAGIYLIKEMVSDFKKNKLERNLER